MVSPVLDYGCPDGLGLPVLDYGGLTFLYDLAKAWLRKKSGEPINRQDWSIHRWTTNFCGGPNKIMEGPIFSFFKAYTLGKRRLKVFVLFPISIESLPIYGSLMHAITNEVRDSLHNGGGNSGAFLPKATRAQLQY